MPLIIPIIFHISFLNQKLTGTDWSDYSSITAPKAKSVPILFPWATHLPRALLCAQNGSWHLPSWLTSPIVNWIRTQTCDPYLTNQSTFPEKLNHCWRDLLSSLCWSFRDVNQEAAGGLADKVGILKDRIRLKEETVLVVPKGRFPIPGPSGLVLVPDFLWPDFSSFHLILGSVSTTSQSILFFA